MKLIEEILKEVYMTTLSYKKKRTVFKISSFYLLF